MRINRLNKWRLVFIVVVCVVSYLLHHFTGMPLWGAMVIVVASIVGNGLIAEWEDNRPGGFNNPKRKPSKSDTQ